MRRFVSLTALLAMLLVALPGTISAAPPAGTPDCRLFPETGHSLCGNFLHYWDAYGGLAVYGYPLTDEFVDPVTGVVTQWLERARFELHPGTWPERFDVQLGLLGNELASGRSNEAPFQRAAPDGAPGCDYFEPTGHNLCAGFHDYWDNFGGLAVYGMPISEEFREVNADTGVEYTVQYFERQRVEWHPGEWPERYDTMLGRLGAELYHAPDAAAPAPAGMQAAQVVRVVDGDTIVVAIGGREYTVRLIGIDTPETVHPTKPVMCYGPEASQRTKALIEAAGNTVLLEKDISETDKYNRLLRYVWLDLPGGRTMLDYELVRWGYAQVTTYPPDVKYVELFTAAQAQARAEGAGLWGACGGFGAPETPPAPPATPPPPPSTPAPPVVPPVSPSERSGVTPGAFCSPQGALGRTSTGKAMICTTTATDSRARWRQR